MTTALAQKFDPSFIWAYVSSDEDAHLAVAEQFGFSEEEFRRLESSRPFMSAVFEAQREFMRYKAMAMLLVNQEQMFDTANGSSSLADKTTLHNTLAKLTNIEQTGAAAGGAGFVLNINIPGAALTLSGGDTSDVVPVEAALVEDAKLVEDKRADSKRLPGPRVPRFSDVKGISEELMRDLDEIE